MVRTAAAPAASSPSPQAMEYSRASLSKQRVQGACFCCQHPQSDPPPSGGLVARVRTLTLTAYDMPVLAHNFIDESGFLLSVPSLLMSLVTGVGMFFLAKH